jgi:hypothetical protein
MGQKIFVVPIFDARTLAGYAEHWSKLAFDLANYFYPDYEAKI